MVLTSTWGSDCAACGIRTVSSHLKSLKRKLNVTSNAELVRFAIKQGLITE